jgi:hypothetical protein
LVLLSFISHAWCFPMSICNQHFILVSVQGDFWCPLDMHTYDAWCRIFVLYHPFSFDMARFSFSALGSCFYFRAPTFFALSL